jgi:hypothetical protein
MRRGRQPFITVAGPFHLSMIQLDPNPVVDPGCEAHKRRGLPGGRPSIVAIPR